MSRKICEICGTDDDWICERCLRCKSCCSRQDQQRALPDQHLGKWLWSRHSLKGAQLEALVTAGHGKGDYPGKKRDGDA